MSLSNFETCVLEELAIALIEYRRPQEIVERDELKELLEEMGVKKESTYFRENLLDVLAEELHKRYKNIIPSIETKDIEDYRLKNNGQLVHIDSDYTKLPIVDRTAEPMIEELDDCRIYNILSKKGLTKSTVYDLVCFAKQYEENTYSDPRERKYARQNYGKVTHQKVVELLKKYGLAEEVKDEKGKSKVTFQSLQTSDLTKAGLGIYEMIYLHHAGFNTVDDIINDVTSLDELREKIQNTFQVDFNNPNVNLTLSERDHYLREQTKGMNAKEHRAFGWNFRSKARKNFILSRILQTLNERGYISDKSAEISEQSIIGIAEDPQTLDSIDIVTESIKAAKQPENEKTPQDKGEV